MPDSQENEWRDLGHTSEVNLTLPEIDWEGMAMALRDLTEAFRAIRPVVVEGTLSEQQVERIQETQMAIDTRHGEYPRRDGDGTYWYDPSTLHTDESGVCFICKRPTNRLDIDYHGHFCGSEECNDFIRQDLERLNGGPEVRD